MENHFPILIAEDNPVSRRLLEVTLSKAGHDVTSVQNGREALDEFRNKFFPIVLTDWIMPEMDGLDLCRAIRESKSEGYVFIIILTANDSQEDIITGFGAGADDYLTKPFDYLELMARLNSARRVLELERSLKRAYAEIRTLSITDALTGSYNRGYLMDRFPQEIKRARRYGHPLSLVMCDIDHFKKVNDSFGHLVGDSVLKVFVRRMKDTIRDDVDWVARYGGEEFLIVLPETNIEGSFRMIERLQGILRNKLLELDGKDIRISASFGVTGFEPDTPDDNLSPENLINQADKFLYQAKLEGRDRVRGGLA